MKAVILMITLWGLFISHCSAESSVVNEEGDTYIIDSLIPLTKGSLAGVLNGEGDVLRPSIDHTNERIPSIYDKMRGLGKQGRSPAVVIIEVEAASGK